MKNIRNDQHDSSLAAQEGPLLISASKLNLVSGMRSTGMSMDIIVRLVGVCRACQKNLKLQEEQVI